MAAGVVGSDHVLRLVVLHADIPVARVQWAFTRRWPTALFCPATALPPPFVFNPVDAARLGLARRGTEPLRVVIMAQHAPVKPCAPAPMHRDPLPFTVG